MKGLRPWAQLGADRPHGDRRRYMAGCKCFKCRRANSDYERARIVARAAGDWNGVVPADRARAHLVKLSRGGLGLKAVAAATDLARSILNEIRSAAKRQIRARTERKILAVTFDVRADGSRVPATRVWRLIGELLTEGYTKAALARKMGFKAPAIHFRKDFVNARTEQRVIALHSRLTT